jgi:hypothetical protein
MAQEQKGELLGSFSHLLSLSQWQDYNQILIEHENEIFGSKILLTVAFTCNNLLSKID